MIQTGLNRIQLILTGPTDYAVLIELVQIGLIELIQTGLTLLVQTRLTKLIQTGLIQIRLLRNWVDLDRIDWVDPGRSIQTGLTGLIWKWVGSDWVDLGLD